MIDANRFSPIRCGRVSSSSFSAAPHGVAVFAVAFVATRENVPAGMQRVRDRFVPNLCRRIET